MLFVFVIFRYVQYDKLFVFTFNLSAFSSLSRVGVDCTLDLDVALDAEARRCGVL